ncbi:hypothetical protein [Nitratireductor sp. ZSWI3]|uniref:hypothetical protein n=1 Tax=Nitratireductor sp. ZSWI3 TaxID=2966359 RepID=UPI00214F8152|nr:hypothetical protein [Nitratireductor sp. ZSWI3]MCR4268799.1 hypothetical protein [Nitratireductor sp. ZSWI3]
MSGTLARLARSSAVHMGFAFLAMGGWAVFANRGHAMPGPLLAGLVQGFLSAAITLFLKRAIEWLVAQFGGIAGLVLPPLIACLTSLTLLSAIHALAGTPEILATIALPLTVATSYAALYTYTLWSARP